MVSISELENGISGIGEDLGVFLNKPIGAAIGGAVVGAALTGATIAGVTALKNKSKKSVSKARSKSKRISHTKRGWKQDRARRSKQKWEVAYQKRKKKKKSRKSRTGIHFTKNGQPYKILKSGKARFIKKKR